MLTRCEEANCGKVYDDAEQWTICPHNPLWVSWQSEAFCWRCDLPKPCFHDLAVMDAEQQEAYKQTFAYAAQQYHDAALALWNETVRELRLPQIVLALARAIEWVQRRFKKGE